MPRFDDHEEFDEGYCQYCDRPVRAKDWVFHHNIGFCSEDCGETWEDQF